MAKTEKFAIEMNNVSKTYSSGEIKVQALKNLDLTITKGERICILGPSGSGKTTLLNLLGGITSPDKDSSKMKVFSNDIKNFKRNQLTDYRCERVGFIFQFFNLFPALNALDNVIIGIELLRKKIKRELNCTIIAKNYLKMVGLEDRLLHYPSQLSGGEQQRVAIARALAKIPFVGKEFLLLCDEPTGNLDTETGEKIITLIKELNEREGFTCIMVTHSINLAKHFTSKIINLKNGHIEE